MPHPVIFAKGRNENIYTKKRYVLGKRLRSLKKKFNPSLLTYEEGRGKN
jgi:hypothetical protein